MADQLRGKVALITGGTSGIGEATVELFVREGAKVMIAARNSDKGNAMVTKLGPSAHFVQTDVSREKEIKGAIDMTVNVFGRLDCIFNNAGGPARGAAETFSRQELDDAMGLLLYSVLFGIKYAAPIMRSQGGGAIINNSSVAAVRGHMGSYLYSIAKAGVTRATQMAGIELGQYGITVNCISPGGIATPIFFGGSAAATAMAPELADAKLKKLARNLVHATPLRRSGMPQDVAAAALFLASDAGAYINCHDLVVDGGMVAGGRNSFQQNTPGAPV
jgi:NAD(P)-dependent dehydrogenase (short-subunit alcohol dehydrogenase family)